LNCCWPVLATITSNKCCWQPTPSICCWHIQEEDKIKLDSSMAVHWILSRDFVIISQFQNNLKIMKAYLEVCKNI
jgi:hypothetical protein